MPCNCNNTGSAEVRALATGMANDVERLMAQMTYFANKVAGCTEEMMTELGLEPEYQANLGSMKNDLLALEAWYRANCNFVGRFAQFRVF